MQVELCDFDLDEIRFLILLRPHLRLVVNATGGPYYEVRSGDFFGTGDTPKAALQELTECQVWPAENAAKNSHGDLVSNK